MVLRPHTGHEMIVTYTNTQGVSVDFASSRERIWSRKLAIVFSNRRHYVTALATYYISESSSGTLILES